MASQMPKTFSFPIWLKGTPEQQKTEAERQALARASFTRAHMTEAERMIGRGKLIEEAARQNLRRSNTSLAQSQLADALAMQGRFAEAAKLHPDESRRQYFENIIHALEMDGEEKCHCPDDKARMNDVDLSFTPRYESQRIFSPLHNDVVSVIVCSKCGHVNARKPKSRLLHQQSALNQSEAAKKPVLNDAQVKALHAAK